MTAPVRLLAIVLAAILPQGNQDTTPKAVRDPLTMAQVLVWMDGGAESPRVEQLVERQGVDFVPTAEFLDSLKVLNAKPSLLEKLKSAKVVHSTAGSAKEQAAYAELFTCLQKANSGADAEAERECLAAETDEPSTARFALGLLAKRRGKSSEALRSFSSAVEAAPTIPDNHNYLAWAFRKLGELDHAEAEYREAMRLDPAYETPVSNLADIYLAKNDPVQAERYAREAIALMGEDAWAHNELGIALCKQQKFSECLAELREAERLDPENAFRHTQLGTTLWNTGKCSDAVHEFQQATKLDPSNSYTHIRLLTLLLQLGRKDDAQTECETIQAVMHTKKTCTEIAAIIRKDTEKAPKLCGQP
jgi:Flp pilus assembly protein TadD